jgi:hypothetical protein
VLEYLAVARKCPKAVARLLVLVVVLAGSRGRRRTSGGQELCFGQTTTLFLLLSRRDMQTRVMGCDDDPSWREPSPPEKHGFISEANFYIYTFYHDFGKIYGPPEILQNYTSAAVAHVVRDITSWSTAVGAASSGPLVCGTQRRTPRRQGPSAVGYYVMS